ncbi:MAG: type II toxin-antitoxin system Phd/YefM family antitoxin [Nitrococcus sp.]|nr:type II toxin-antitoxin system Phd/YefM family antitoxin [Nitrococcus sp.]
MNRQVNIYDARMHFSRLIQEAAAGEEIVIAKSGKPVAKLVPYRPPTAARQPGAWRGRVRVSADFDTLPEELEAAFRGEAE